MAVPIAHGAKVRPVWIALKPWPSCRYSDIVSMSPIIPAKNTSATTTPTEYARVRSRLVSTSEERPVRSRRASCHAKAPKATTLAAIDTNVHAGQPASRPWMSGRISSVQAPVTRIAPATSSDGASFRRDSGSRRSAATNATMPTGTLTRKIARQPRPKRSPSTSAPPMIGPSTAAPPMTGPNIPKALAISSFGNDARTIPKPCGIMTAAKPPCSSRKAMSSPAEAATPQSTEASVNPAMPMRKRRRRP